MTMLMDPGPASLVSPAKLQKMVLAKRIGQFLVADQSAEERRVVENVARMLAEDISAHVREVLAFELRRCEDLSFDLAERIARDVESVSGPFLATANCFTDDQLATLIPRLQEKARITLARRTDLGDRASVALVEVGEEDSVTYLVRNDHLTLCEGAVEKLLARFGENRRLMDHLSARIDLPLSLVEDIARKVSDHCRAALVRHYNMAPKAAASVTRQSFEASLWDKIKDASRNQVHAYVVDLRKDKRMTNELILKMAEKGSLYFLESALAIEAELTVGEVREALSMKRKPDFVKLMQKADVPQKLGPRFLALAHKHYRL